MSEQEQKVNNFDDSDLDIHESKLDNYEKKGAVTLNSDDAPSEEELDAAYAEVNKAKNCQDWYDAGSNVRKLLGFKPTNPCYLSIEPENPEDEDFLHIKLKPNPRSIKDPSTIKCCERWGTTSIPEPVTYEEAKEGSLEDLRHLRDVVDLDFTRGCGKKSWRDKDGLKDGSAPPQSMEPGDAACSMNLYQDYYGGQDLQFDTIKEDTKEFLNLGGDVKPDTSTASILVIATQAFN